MYFKSVYESPMGNLHIITDESFLIELKFDNDSLLSKYCNNAVLNSANGITAETHLWLDRYFTNQTPNPSELNISAAGTVFRMRVWDILKSIPYGEVRTYGEIADIYCKKFSVPKMSTQAIGGAVGHNPIGIIIPCHRVVGSDKSMTGFSGGIDKKIWLLKHEGHSEY